MRRIFQRAEAGLGRREAGWVLLAVVAVAYAAACGMHPLNPGNGDGAAARGWWTWNDQSRYLAESAAIATGRLEAETFTYPIGYPALGAVGWRLWRAQPFFVPDLLLVLAAAGAWWRIARRWLGATAAVATAVVFVASHATLIGLTSVVPWNTIATQAALLAGVAAMLGGTGRRRVLVLAGLAAAAYVVKPSDAAAFGPLLAVAVGRVGNWRERLASGAAAAGVLGAAVGAVGVLHLAVFGQWRSPYEVASVQVAGFFSYPMAMKAYWLLLDGRSFFGEWELALAWRYPWLWLVVPGAVWLVRRERAAGAAVLAAVAVSWGLYLNYNDFLPSDVYRFTLVHYLTWSFPLLFLLGVAAVVRGWRERMVRVGFAVAAGMVMLGAGAQLMERPVVAEPAGAGVRLPETRPLVVRWRGAGPEAAREVRIDGRELVEARDFVMPYVPVDELRILLSTTVRGAVVSREGGGGARPELGELVWGWRFSPARLRRMVWR